MKLGYSMRLAMRHKHHHSFASSRAHTHLGETSNRADALPCIARMRWIKSPAWDLVWVLNTVWLAPLVFLLGLGHDDVRASPVDWLFFVLAVPLWFGHRVASAWIAYATPVKGLYICSSSTPPGGGVHGLCGYFAARSVQRYLKS